MRSALAFLLVLLLPTPPGQEPGLDPACAGGSAPACYSAASRLLKSARTRADTAGAVAHYRKGCELRDGGACNDWGVALINGQGVPRDPPAGIRAYIQGCDLGSPVACRNYGYNLFHGNHGLGQDSARGAAILGRACERDNQNACVELGLIERNGLRGRTPRDGLNRLIWACDKFYTRGCLQAGYSLRDSLGVAADFAAAAGFFKRACDQNSNETDPQSAGDGCSALGYAYANGQGVARNPGRAESLYRRGCDFNSAYSCTELGLAAMSASPPDTVRAAGYYTKSCDLKQPAGCGNLGLILQKGWPGRAPDSAAARRLLQGSCDGNFASGCRWLADAILAGVGGRIDSSLAYDTYQKACDRRNASSCVDLGRAYHYGWGRPRDERRALTLYETACAAGNSMGCNNLGVLLSEGSTALRNLDRANGLFERECETGNSKACANLGYSFEYARGKPLDERRAIELYKKSCLAKDGYGCDRLKKIAPDSVAILGNLVGSDGASRGNAAGSTGPTTVAELKDRDRGLWALVVGISRYASKDIRPLGYARKDAEAFASFLMSPQGGGFQPERVQVLVDEKATAEALRRGMHSFLRRAGENDLVVIYFAGHGRQPGNAGGVPYFLTHDTDPREMAVTAVPMDELTRAVNQSISARHIVAFVDACHSGGVTMATRSGADNELIARYLRELGRSKETVITFSAAQENQESLEGPEFGGGHGAFTWHLLQGLRGDADRVSEGGDESGTVTIREIAGYVSRKVKAATGNQQEPSISGGRIDPTLVLSVIRPR